MLYTSRKNVAATNKKNYQEWINVTDFIVKVTRVYSSCHIRTSRRRGIQDEKLWKSFTQMVYNALSNELII